MQPPQSNNQLTYSQAKLVCESQMTELKLRIQDLSDEEQQAYLQKAQEQLDVYL